MRYALSLFGNIRVRNGRGIVSVILTSTVGLTKTYTITYTDATTSTFTVNNGADGVSTYTYVAYASDNTGTGFSLTPTDLLKYRAEIHSTTVLTPVEADFWGATWVKYLGDDGSGGSLPKQVTGLTLLSTGWTLVSGLYEYDLANANITATSIVEVIPANADIATVKAAEILPETDSSTGSVKIYSTNAPTANIGVTINIFEATT